MRRRFHRLAIVESAQVGEGTRVWAFAHVMKGARVGARCNLGEGVFVESGVVIGDDVTVKNGVALYDGVTVEDEAFLGPHAVFTNDLRPRSGRFKRPPAKLARTRIGRGATVGANATVLCGHLIGPHAMIAAGAVVTADVAAHALCAGVPARRIGFVCACGERLPRGLRCGCGRRYRRAGAGLAAVDLPASGRPASGRPASGRRGARAE
ncbi:MAG TPA: acyltransferase [Polyangia bacterium]